MPRKEINDYSFYKIVCLDNSINLCYVGSTANFNARKRSHKFACNSENKKKYNSKLYTTIRQNGGWDNFKMIEIGKKEQLTYREAEQIEEEYRQDLKANMNSLRCYRTEQEKKEQENKSKKKYFDENRKLINERKKGYYLAYKERIPLCSQ